MVPTMPSRSCFFTLQIQLYYDEVEITNPNRFKSEHSQARYCLSLNNQGPSMMAKPNHYFYHIQLLVMHDHNRAENNNIKRVWFN